MDRSKVILDNGTEKEFKSIVVATNYAINYVQGRSKSAYTKERFRDKTIYTSDKRQATLIL